jgi:hypothetical protein
MAVSNLVGYTTGRSEGFSSWRCPSPKMGEVVVATAKLVVIGY